MKTKLLKKIRKRFIVTYVTNPEKLTYKDVVPPCNFLFLQDKEPMCKEDRLWFQVGFIFSLNVNDTKRVYDWMEKTNNNIRTCETMREGINEVRDEILLRTRRDYPHSAKYQFKRIVKTMQKLSVSVSELNKLMKV